MSKPKSQKMRAQAREAAEARQEAYSKLTVQEKIEALDKMFGPGNGAAKQRKKLQKQL